MMAYSETKPIDSKHLTAIGLGGEKAKAKLKKKPLT